MRCLRFSNPSLNSLHFRTAVPSPLLSKLQPDVAPPQLSPATWMTIRGFFDPRFQRASPTQTPFFVVGKDLWCETQRVCSYSSNCTSPLSVCKDRCMRVTPPAFGSGSRFVHFSLSGMGTRPGFDPFPPLGLGHRRTLQFFLFVPSLFDLKTWMNPA